MKNSPPLTIYKKIAGLFILLTIILVFVIFYYSLTYAFIIINPEVGEASYDFNLLITEDSSAVDGQKGVLQGVLIDQELEVSNEYEAMGTTVLKSEAEGRVVLINNYSRVQPLVATTRLLTKEGVLFRISDPVEVPIGGRVEVDVYQDSTEPSIVSLGTKFTIPGLSQQAQEFIYAEAVSDFGGNEREVKVVTKEDLENATNDLVTDVKNQISETIQDGSQGVLKVEVLDKEFSNLSGDQVDNFTAKIRARITGAVFAKADANTYASLLFENSLSNDAIVNENGVSTLTYEIDNYDAENHLVQLSGNISSTAVLRENSSQLKKDKLTKLTEEEVIAYLENLPEINSAEVKFFPFWVHRTPSFEDHILIEFKSDTN